MAGFWKNRADGQRSEVSADFRRALAQEVLRTELIRIKALIGTTALLAAILCTIYILVPDAVNQVWHGRLKPPISIRS